ncbi:hypothetical protein D3C77_524230 [compost metagenome]
MVWAVRKASATVKVAELTNETFIYPSTGFKTTNVCNVDIGIGIKKIKAICFVAAALISLLLSPILESAWYIRLSADNSECSLKYKKLAVEMEKIKAIKTPIKLNTEVVFFVLQYLLERIFK